MTEIEDLLKPKIEQKAEEWNAKNDRTWLVIRIVAVVVGIGLALGIAIVFGPTLCGCTAVPDLPTTDSWCLARDLDVPQCHELVDSAFGGDWIMHYKCDHSNSRLYIGRQCPNPDGTVGNGMPSSIEFS